MRYRINQRTGDKISEIGIGSAYMYEAGMEEAVRALRKAYEHGINYFDLAAGDGASFPIYGEAFDGIRKNIMFQIHFGADYTKGTYGWSLDLDTIKRAVDDQLGKLRTDYIDYGFIHCQDEHSDWETYQKNGILDYILEMQKAGVVRHIGLSSHTPGVIQEILNTGLVDMLMFSVNPAYDYGKGDYAHGDLDERAAVYKRCQKEGIGISVMKPFSGGQLLDASRSPFGHALSIYQCIQYALDKPGVLTVLPGAQSTEEIDALLAYYDQPETALDYAVISSFAPADASGKCVYCNHCKPCPVGLDIGLINKYYDLAVLGDDMAAGHYHALSKNASDCIGCGHCDKRCPFHVAQSARMKDIQAFFAQKK
ncbi:MAG: aldo/keto reductase [Proteobacteria bacterium]|nr:aldo/keto reductase [Pseudomonadota bacterium]